MDPYKGMADVMTDLKERGTDTRSIAIQYAVSGKDIAIIDAQRVSGTELVPNAVHPVGETYKWVERHGKSVSLCSKYVLAANGQLYLADGITVQPFFGRHASDSHKFFGLIMPTGTVVRRRPDGSTIRDLQRSSSLVDILRDAHRRA
jgi:hypothetical protein